MPVPFPLFTTCTMKSRTCAAVASDVARFQTFGAIVSSGLPASSVTLWPTCGCMITPLFAIPAATSAICNGVVNTLPCPIPARADRTC